MLQEIAFMCSNEGTVEHQSAEVPRATMASISATLRARLTEEAAQGRGEFAVPGGRARIYPTDGEHYLIVFRQEHEEAHRLTTRQRQVAEFAASGATIDEIARHLEISPHTVRQHLRDAYRTLDVGNRVELARALVLVG